MKYLFSLLLLTQLSFLQAQKDWLLEKDKNGVQVFTRKLGHHKIKELKAITYSSKSVAELEQIIKDVVHFPDWVYSVSYGVLLEENGNRRILYYTFDVPWPASNRDVVVESYTTHDEFGNLKFELKIVNNLKPEVPGYVRMKEVLGSWTLIPEGDKTKIVYQFYGDPSGHLPVWLVNMFIVEGPYETMVNLQKY